MLKLTYNSPVPAVEEGEEEPITSALDLTLLNEKDRPTPTAVGLVALELAFDVAVAFGIYSVLKLIRK